MQNQTVHSAAVRSRYLGDQMLSRVRGAATAGCSAAASPAGCGGTPAASSNTRTDASAVADYFKPLDAWLVKQNKGQKCGW